jgi:hypothetical protein
MDSENLVDNNTIDLVSAENGTVFTIPRAVACDAGMIRACLELDPLATRLTLNEPAEHLLKRVVEYMIARHAVAPKPLMFYDKENKENKAMQFASHDAFVEYLDPIDRALVAECPIETFNTHLQPLIEAALRLDHPQMFTVLCAQAARYLTHESSDKVREYLGVYSIDYYMEEEEKALKALDNGAVGDVLS